MKLTIVGASGTFPGPHSGCSSYLLEEDGFRLLLDVGNGSTGALQAACGLLGPDAVIVSHLHGDHYLDLITYTYARRYHPEGQAPLLPVYGPSDIRDQVIGAYGRDVSDLLDEVYIIHPVETYGTRSSAGGRTLTYSADTGETSTVVDLAKNVDLFLCEASYLDGEDNPPDIHLTGKQAAQYATQADVQRLLLTHLVPWGDKTRTLAEADAAYSGELLVARTLDVYDV